MAHQAHSIPWGTLASNFGYTKNSNGVYDIHALGKPTQPESLIHFAKIFAKTLREYAAIERRKYPAAEEYKKRARTWMRSSRRPDGDESMDDDVPVVKGKPVESKKIYSDRESELWRARRRAYGLGVGNDDTQYIDNWIYGTRHWGGALGTPNYDSQTRDRWVTYWTDDWKHLMMEAALVNTPLHERQAKRDDPDSDHRRHMDTLFLLAHHPDIPLLEWAHEGDACCNFESGLVCLLEGAIAGYVYFNLLHAMRETGSKVCQLTEDFVIFEDWDCFNWRCGSITAPRRLKPRPRYMNTASWYRILQQTCMSHEHHLEIMMFDPFLVPRVGENFTILPSESMSPDASASLWHRERFNGYDCKEVDVMTAPHDGSSQVTQEPLKSPGNHEALHEFLRGLWKLMVNYEMMWTDQGKPPHWEKIVMDQLEQSFRTDKSRFGLIWESVDQCIQHGDPDLFRDGKVEMPPRPYVSTNVRDAQKANNNNIKREARREARKQDKSKPCVRRG